MTNEQAEATAHPTRRNVMLGAGAAAIAVVAGVGFYLRREPAPVTPAAAADEVPLSELMLPGPLGDQVLGEANAPVTIIEYASMTCPHCSHFHETTYPELKKKYIDTGKVRFIFREFPLDSLALAGSMLARCAGKDKYFPMIEALFAQQKDWVVKQPLQPLLNIAKQAGFTEQTFNECLENKQLETGVMEISKRAATAFNVNSTPTLFINGKIYRGALTIEELDKQLDSLLKG
jgi:protein-disulfide isomerase